MARMLYASASRAGVISLSPTIPAGEISFAHDWESRLRPAIEVCARLSYDGKTLLVPGVPEAEDGDLALDALIAFQRQVDARLLRPGG
jgi:hypothetical protein